MDERERLFNVVTVTTTVVQGGVSASETGSIVSLLCDSGERYMDTIIDDAWIARQGFDLAPWTAKLESGVFDAVLESASR